MKFDKQADLSLIEGNVSPVFVLLCQDCERTFDRVEGWNHHEKLFNWRKGLIRKVLAEVMLFVGSELRLEYINTKSQPLGRRVVRIVGFEADPCESHVVSVLLDQAVPFPANYYQHADGAAGDVVMSDRLLWATDSNVRAWKKAWISESPLVVSLVPDEKFQGALTRALGS